MSFIKLCTDVQELLENIISTNHHVYLLSPRPSHTFSVFFPQWIQTSLNAVNSSMRGSRYVCVQLAGLGVHIEVFNDLS